MIRFEKFDTSSMHRKFIVAKPFPHLIIDDLFDLDIFESLSDDLDGFYNLNKGDGTRWNTMAESGKWGSTGVELPKSLETLNTILKSPKFIHFIEEITGFKNLKVTSNINGSSFSFFHAMQPGSFLAPHTDHTRDLNKGPYHVANIIFYMSKKWDPNWGGGTTIFSPKNKLQSDIEFRPNRALIFMHSPNSIHGTQGVSKDADYQRYSIYYDFYSSSNAPFDHLNLEKKIILNDSPHRFYLRKFYQYFLPQNSKYLKAHLSHFKNLLMYKITGKP